MPTGTNTIVFMNRRAFHFFFFKPKAAFVFPLSPVGSEMCIRGRVYIVVPLVPTSKPYSCLLYTLDPADEKRVVNRGGARVFKKKQDVQNVLTITYGSLFISILPTNAEPHLYISTVGAAHIDYLGLTATCHLYTSEHHAE